MLQSISKTLICTVRTKLDQGSRWLCRGRRRLGDSRLCISCTLPDTKFKPFV